MMIPMKLTKMYLLSLFLISSVLFISAMTVVAQTNSATRRLYVATGGGFDLNEAAANDALKAGADINWRNDAMGGETMLIMSIKGFKEPNIIKYLLDHGADASIKDDTGKTALDWANQYNLGKNRNGRTILAMLEAASGENGPATPTDPDIGHTTKPTPPAPLPEPQPVSPRGAPSIAEIKGMIEEKMTINYENHFGGNELNKVTFEWLGPVQVIGTDVRGRIPHKCWNVKLDLKVTFEKPSSGEIGSVTRGIQGRPIREMFCIWRQDGGALDFVTYQP